MEGHPHAHCGLHVAQQGAEPALSGVQVGFMAVVCVTAQPVGYGGRVLWLRQVQVGQVKRAPGRLEPGVHIGQLNTAGAQMVAELAAVPLLHSLL